ncbi:Hypothetical predicted protein [Pelobates cultripes]|uniref:GIY-YIG domain-containing protein n=1 Tax=Pelobates cultripes TaxID=61616 RepID=A0AAD1RC67_PELCU|nr:Hypothetical predicted protein [Pelobates cultripes]
MVQDLNLLPTPVRFTADISTEKVHYLDLEISLGATHFQYSLYTKPTDRNTLLHYQSAHPRALKNSLPKAQFLRVIRNNSEVGIRDVQIFEMKNKFLQRGYDECMLETALQEALNARATETKKKALNLVFPMVYNQSTPQVASVIRKNWRIVSSDDTLPKVFKEKPLICYKRNRNLKDMLVRTDPSQSYLNIAKEQIRGSVRCLGCVTCSHMTPARTFFHPHNNRKYTIRYTITCKTTHVIYKLSCPCGLCYIGKTETAICERIRGHRSSIRLAYRDGSTDKPVAKHFFELKHPLATLKFVAIDHIPNPRRGWDRGRMLLNREAYWIHELDTVSPKGLNEALSLHSFLA